MNKRKSASDMNKPKKIRKASKHEEEIIKRILKYRDVEKEDQTSKAIKDNDNKNVKESYDLWGMETQGKVNQYKKVELNYPKVPLPHPGQSYNPSKNDLKNLLSKVVEHNTPLDLPPPSTIINDVKTFDEDEEEEVDPNEHCSNNPATKSTDKLSRKDRNKLVNLYTF